MVSYVLSALADAGVSAASVVTGPDGAWISKRVSAEPTALNLRFVNRGEARGNADAALVGLTALDEGDDDDIVILPADLPLISASVISEMIAVHQDEGAACTVLVSSDPDAAEPISGVASRIVLDRRGTCVAITRSPQRVSDELTVGAESLGIFIVKRELLAPVLRRVSPDPFNRQTSLDAIVEVLAESGHRTAVAVASNPHDLRPVDSRLQLADAEAELRRRTNDYWMRRGVTMVDPTHTYVDTTVLLGKDITLFPGTMLQGATVVGDRSRIGPNTRLVECRVGNDCVVEMTSARSAVIGDDCVVGPFAELRAGSVIEEATVTGAFYAAGAGDR